ncbi:MULTISPECIES: stage II sporulation protein D [Clostridium]|uniref:Stage II sporulation protein D n=1 Tax=Clostridium lapidicellarium TaxID=3240931 RepID=A0ABV4DTQ3_9CLOT|nr:stage II sporulation protein D [uncultured Clostridium sp.]
MNFLKKFAISVLMSMLFIILLSLVMTGKGGVEKGLPKFIIKSKAEPQNIKVYMTREHKIEEMTLENYVLGVVAGEMPAEFSEEALKAQAVAARTFGVAHMEAYGGKKYKSNTGADVCDTVECQVFKSKEERMDTWPKSKANEYWLKIKQAVQDTSGQVLSYKGKLVMEPYYFAISGGRTENAKDVFEGGAEYLKSVDSPGEENGHNKYKTSLGVSYKDFVDKINLYYPGARLNAGNLSSEVSIQDRTEGGAVKEIRLGSIIISGTKFRAIMGLNSTNFNINFRDKIYIDCLGYGHRVGMSQWGADAMGKNGKTYVQILSHYYTGIKLKDVSLFLK